MFDHAKYELKRILDDFITRKRLAAMLELNGFNVNEHLYYFIDMYTKLNHI